MSRSSLRAGRAIRAVALAALAALAAASLLVGSTAPALAAPVPEIIDLLHFQTNDADAWESLHRRSDSLPFTMEELEKLTAAGIAEKTLIEIIRTRRLLVVADADTLVRLKKKGASDAVVAAVSAYALPPNRSIDLAFQVQVATPYQVTQAPYLYVEVVHLDSKTQETFMFADMRRLLANKWRVDVVEDRSDPLLPTRVRTLRFWGHAPARRPGRLEIRALVTQRAGLTTLDTLTEVERKGLRTWQVDYPGVSLLQACEMQLQLNRDPVLKDLFAIERADFRCRWD
jgi:hypothetical protein